MVKKGKEEALDSKEKVLSELGVNSVQELSGEGVFRKLITLDAKVDKEILGMILPKIENFSELVIKQQEFISDLAEKQKHIDEKALESFNQTKAIITEVLKANPKMDKEVMIYLFDALKEMDRYISDHAYESGRRIERLINSGLAIGGAVAVATLAIIFNGGRGIDKNS